jgi:hypothetical protein
MLRSLARSQRRIERARLNLEPLEVRALLSLGNPLGIHLVADTEPSAGSEAFALASPTAGGQEDPPIIPPPPGESNAPPLGGTIEGINFDENAANGGFFNIPPDPHGAVGPNHLVSIVNTSIEWHTKAGVQQNSQRLGRHANSSIVGSFFAPLTPANGLFDPR